MTAEIIQYGLFPKEPFRALVEQLMYPVQTLWYGAPQAQANPFMGRPGVILELDVRHIERYGRSEQRLIWDPVTQANAVLIAQQCVYTIAFGCQSYSFEETAYETLQRLYLRLRRAGTKAALREMGVGTSTYTDIVTVSETRDNRFIEAGMFTGDFTWAAYETDETDTGGWIETINGGTTNPGDPGYPAVGDIPDVPPFDPIMGTQ